MQIGQLGRPRRPVMTNHKIGDFCVHLQMPQPAPATCCNCWAVLARTAA